MLLQQRAGIAFPVENRHDFDAVIDPSAKNHRLTDRKAAGTAAKIIAVTPQARLTGEKREMVDKRVDEEIGEAIGEAIGDVDAAAS